MWDSFKSQRPIFYKLLYVSKLEIISMRKRGKLQTCMFPRPHKRNVLLIYPDLDILATECLELCLYACSNYRTAQ